MTSRPKLILAPKSNLHEIGQIVENARLAQKIWARQTFAERKVHIDRILSYIVENADELVEVLCQDTGKTRLDALTDEVLPCAFACKWYGENAERVLRTKSLKTSIPIMLNKRSAIARIPLGLVGIISPWNYPLAIPFGEVIMALMAGNAVLLKTSFEVTPRIGPLIQRMVDVGQLRPHLFTLIQGDAAEIADAFFAQGVDKVFFTGSVRVGKELMRKASETLTPLCLELGGNDPMIVLEDADLERTTNGAAWGAYQNAGQTCAGIERAYIHESVYDKFVDLLAKKTKMLTHGHFRSVPDIGAVTNVKQLETIQSHIDDAISKGARIVAQSQAKDASPGYFFPATLLVDVDHRMTIMKEETFGPVLGVMKFKEESEALRLANDSHYALTSSVWTKNLERGKKLALQLESGVTTINDHTITHAFSETPWGGWKHSGIGRTHGAAGLEEMTHCKVLNWDMLSPKRNLYWYPADTATYEGMKTAMHACFAKTPREFLENGRRLLPFAVRKMFSDWSLSQKNEP